MNNHYNKLKNKSLEILLLPIIFLFFMYISYGVVVQGFISTELQNYYSLNQNIILLLNIPIFLGIMLGFYIYKYLIKYKKLFYLFLILSVSINALIIILENYICFSLMRLISGIGYGLLLNYLFDYYYFYKSKLNRKRFSLEWKNPFGILLASFFSYYFAQILGWKSVFSFLLNGFFLIIGITFLPKINRIRYSLSKNFINKKDLPIFLFLIIYFIIGNNFYILILNVKYIFVSLLNDHILSNIYLIYFSFSIILGNYISIYIYKKFDMKYLIIFLNILLIFISSLGLNVLFYYQSVYIILLNVFIQTILWNIFLVYTSTYFNTLEIFNIIKLVVSAFLLGGLFSIIFSFFMFEKLYQNIFILIIIFSILFIMIFFKLSKNYDRYNHFMKR